MLRMLQMSFQVQCGFALNDEAELDVLYVEPDRSVWECDGD